MATKKNRCLTATFVVCALIGGASLASAQATRTWVSGVGDDVNPCSRTAPCKTFAGAISKTAAKGAINVLDPGGFGVVTITKSISIEGQNSLSAVLGAGTNGIIINAAGTDVVTLRGLVIDGFGTGLNGIRILNASVVHIENCTIQNFVNRGIDVENTAGPVQVFVRDTIIRNNFLGGAGTPGISGGVLLRPTASGSVKAFFDNVHIDQNEFGLRAENNSQVNVYNSSANDNVLFGFIAVASAGVGAPSVINIEQSSASFNSTGVRSDGTGATIRLSRTQVVSKSSTGILAASGGALLSHQNNSINGNGTPAGSSEGAATSNVGQQ
jgi:hypothetical protein